MSGTRLLAVSVALNLAALTVLAAQNYVPSTTKPPPVLQEFRGMWIATVGNINWPSKPGLSTAEQKQELLRILDRAVELRLNAVLFQVRPACDALYPSQLEPWSEYLSGRMGQAPAPSYDPLHFAVTEAHRRGLELHAWFNPFRARYNKAISPVSAGHVSKTHPEWVRRYGQFQWLDPGLKSARDFSLSVIMDVVRRYDIDGVHIDDYFYPYPEKNVRGEAVDFPDSASWKAYQASGGKLARSDWRRENVNQFVRGLYEAVKSERKHVKVGISPFGIWRPGHPPQIKGFDAYEGLYADALKWLQEGWSDYFAPQLYWPIDQKPQSYPVLLDWWTTQNTKGRHLWPGNSVGRAEAQQPAQEILNQIQHTRKNGKSTGNVLWGAKHLLDRAGLVNALASGPYQQPALVPPSPWLDNTPPPAPKLYLGSSGGQKSAVAWSIDAPNAEQPRKWVVQTRSGGVWQTVILAAQGKTGQSQLKGKPDLISVRAVDRTGNLSAPAVLELTHTQ